MTQIDPKSIVDTRKQLHWASQLLSAAADATLEKAADDSHSNLAWNAESKCLEGRAGFSIDVGVFSLMGRGGRFDLRNKTLSESKNWLSELLNQQIAFREYDMPTHDVANGESFAPVAEHLESICEWFSLAHQALARHGELRVWPHHFDLGFWVPGATENHSIGGGFSLGDEHYNQPYFYINPYGIDRPDSLPELAIGHWSNDWLGAILSASEIQSDDQLSIAARFVESSLSICRGLF